MSIYDDFQDEMKEVIAETGECATYKPNVGRDRKIQVHITRGGAQTMGNQLIPEGAVWVLNDSTDGIASCEIDLGRDMLSIPQRYDTTAKDRAIGKIIEENPAFLILELK